MTEEDEAGSLARRPNTVAGREPERYTFAMGDEANKLPSA